MTLPQVVKKGGCFSPISYQPALDKGVLMNRILSFFLTLFIAGILQPAASSAKMVDGIVAVINDDIILYSELNQAWARLVRATPTLTNESPGKLAQYKRELLQQMVRHRLTSQEAKRLRISVSEQEVDRAIEGIKRENGMTDQQLEVVLGQEGQTLDQFREQVLKEIERSRLMDRIFQSKTVITDAQIDEYLRQHRASGNDRRHLAVISLPITPGMSAEDVATLGAQAEDIQKRLQAGADFSKLARKYSKGPGAAEGGDIGFIASSDLAQPLEEATRNLAPGQTTRVLQSKGGFYILKLLEVETEGAGAADPNARERATRELMRLEINRKFEQWMKNLEERAYVQINYDLLTEKESAATSAD